MNFGSMNNILVSVIICIYNGESYVKKAISSVLAQRHSNFQLIIVDDGSTDNTPAIVDKYASEDSRIEVVHQQNAGVAAARQRGIEIARGEYLMFVDADDWIDEITLERLIWKATETRADLVWMDLVKVIETDTGCKKKRCSFSMEETPDAMIRHFVLWEKPAYMCDKLFRTSIFSNPNVHFPQGSIYAEDLPMIVSFLLYCRKVAYLPEAHYYYLFGNSTSLTNQGTSHRRLDKGIILAIKHMENAFRAASNGEQYFETLLRAKLFTIRNYVDDAGIRDYNRFVNTFPEAIDAMNKYPTYPRRLKIIAWCAKHKLYTIADFVRLIFGILRRLHLSSVGDKEWIKCQ